MNAQGEVDVTRRQHAAAMGLSAVLLGAGVLLTVVASPPSYAASLPIAVLAVTLVPVYVATHRYTLDFELRGESHGIGLVQLPLALGVMVVAPLLHLGLRLLAALVAVVLDRQRPVKALYNVAAAAFEVGAAAFAVGLVDEPGFPPRQWLALAVGLLLGEVVSSLVMSANWRLIGMPVTPAQALRPLVLSAPMALLFTGLAIVTLSAVRVESLTAAIMLALASGLGLAYRTHRKVVVQQQATERLYLLVKQLGPIEFDTPQAVTALEQVRGLLQARELDLAVRRDDHWRHLVVAENRPAVRSRADALPLARRVADAGHALLQGSQDGTPDTMATALLGADGLVGVLTAVDRLSAARHFDMGDLRLLETIGTELSTALERGRLLSDLERSASLDALTGLPNLAETGRQLQQLLTAGDGVVLAAVAVDSFRELNDTLGPQVGDELLLEVTRRLRLAVPEAVVGRVGGGRFAVAVPAGLAGGGAELFGLALRAAVEGTADVGPVGTHVKLAVGVVTAPEHGSDAETLLRRSATAMYSAARSGGGPVLWEPAYEVEGTRRLAVVMALREALGTSAIGVAYQPKVQVATGQVTGVEALARWTHPALGAISPGEFVPLAEACGLMGPLTASLLRQSLSACKAWQRRAPHVGVSINVSADTVLDPAFVTEVAAVLASVGVPAELLTLELTESVLLHDPVLAVDRMRELRRLGVKLSVDDFGTGYSSLTYLKGLPVDEVKIDKGFVDGVAQEPADRAVVRGVVDIAHTLGLRVVAEGVEREDQQGILAALGVDEIQGYLHARPMPAQDVATWLRRRDLSSRT